MTVRVYCHDCGTIIWEGEENLDREETYGEYKTGAGQCEHCGKELCAECGGIEDRVCRECAEQLAGVGL